MILQHCPTKEQVTDIMTKPLTLVVVEKLLILKFDIKTRSSEGILKKI